MQAKDIRFRQAIFREGKFHHWHYWGYVGHNHEFVAPIKIWQQSSPPTYEIKDSQQWTGLHCGKIGLGPVIYEGDILDISPKEPDGYPPHRVQVTYDTTMCAFGLLGIRNSWTGWISLDEFLKTNSAEQLEVIGNLYQTSPLLRREA